VALLRTFAIGRMIAIEEPPKLFASGYFEDKGLRGSEVLYIHVPDSFPERFNFSLQRLLLRVSDCFRLSIVSLARTSELCT
jgi:hypothetical protein